MGDQPLLEAGPGLGRGQRLGVELVAPQAGVERLGLGEQSLERLAAAGADNVVGVLARGKLDESQRAIGASSGKARVAARIAAFFPALSPSKHKIGDGSSRHSRSSCASVSAVPLGATTSAIPGAIERDHVHIALDDEQPLAVRLAGAARSRL